MSNKELDLRPGDLIEWVYQGVNTLDVSEELLWSSVMLEFMKPCRVSLLVNIDEEKISWLNENGLFCVHVLDLYDYTLRDLYIRKCKDAEP
jgi:hypothetical protein